MWAMGIFHSVNFAHDSERGVKSVPNRYSKVEIHASMLLIFKIKETSFQLQVLRSHGIT
jgi:hypothetical protein